MRCRSTAVHHRGGHKTVSVRGYFFPSRNQARMTCFTHYRIHKAVGPQFFSVWEMRKRIEATCRLFGQRCFRTDAKGSTRARILYPHKKRNERRIGVTTENTASKAIADRMLESAKSVSFSGTHWSSRDIFADEMDAKMDRR